MNIQNVHTMLLLARSRRRCYVCAAKREFGTFRFETMKEKAVLDVCLMCGTPAGCIVGPKENSDGN